MVNNFFITRADIIDPKNKEFNFHSCELTTELLNTAELSSPVDLISAIEGFNADKPRNKRIQYAVGVQGFNAPIFVAKAKIPRGKDYIIFYAYNSNGSLYVLNNNEKPKFVDGITTFLVSIDKITGVNFGSFDKDDCSFLFTDDEAEAMTEDQIIKIINEEIEYMNVHISSGEYKFAITHFCMTSQKYDLHTFNFNFNSTAWNRYITLCGTYMNLIKDIVGRHDDKTLNINNPKVPNKMYFFQNSEERDEFLKIAEHPRMNITDNNTFYESDITIYKQILTQKTNN